MPDKPTTVFSENEVRLALIIGLVTGKPFNEIVNKIIAVTANNRTEIDKATGRQKPVDGTSKLAQALAALKNAGYIAR